MGNALHFPLIEWGVMKKREGPGKRKEVMIDMKLVLIGAPAAGKGTQAARLTKHFGIVHISTGDILREEVAKGTKLGREVKAIINASGLVSDELIIAIVKDRILEEDCVNGFILDGFPRTAIQAERLEGMIDLDKVVYINAPDEVMLERLTARQGCPQCGATYNKLFLPPKVENTCDICNTGLTQRKDDTEEVGLKRIETFHNQSEPLVDFYAKKGILIEIDGTKAINDITKSIIESLEK